MVVSIGSDHGGFSQKRLLADHIRGMGFTVLDRGPDDETSVDYPDYAEKVALDVAHGDARFGILVCGTGIGMAIAANKVKGIRAANVTIPEFAKLSREHNDANVLTLSGRFVDPETNIEIVETFLATKFEGGRHERRVGKISDMEDADESE